MGGYGSGHHGERFNTRYVEDSDVLCVWDLQREGFLRAGEIQMGVMRLTSGGSVFLEVDASDIERVWLMADGQRIRLSTTPGVRGGLRWWVHCPVYETRIATLYRHPRIGRFTGREASKLRYRSAYVDRSSQAVLRAQKALRRLAGPAYSGSPTRDVGTIPRPYRQRQATYRRNQLRALESLGRLDDEFRLILDRLVSQSIASR